MAVRVSPAHSGQPSTAKPNPFVEKALSVILKEGLGEPRVSVLRVADQGCGKLRHLHLLKSFFRRLLLVDTVEQLQRKQQIFDTDNVTIVEYLRKHYPKGNVTAIDSVTFESSRLKLDLVFNACVMDVVLPRARHLILRAAAQNLRRGGFLVLIVPRNDQSILVRCEYKNRFQDGHVFTRQGITTFYVNFRDHSPLVRSGEQLGLRLVHDLSVYRQVCLIFRK